MTCPRRVRMRRQLGFNLQATSAALNGLPCRLVTRNTMWGNPFRVGDPHEGGTVQDVAHAVRLFHAWTVASTFPYFQRIRDNLHMLRGQNLACFCALDAPCHADVLLDLANDEARR